MTQGSEPPGPPRNPEQIAVDIAIRLAAMAGFAYIALTLIRPFADILIWSLILTVALYPVFVWLRASLGGRANVAATLLTLLSLLIVFGPIAILSTSLIDSLEKLAHALRSGSFAIPGPPPELSALPVVGAKLAEFWTTATSNLTEAFQKYGHTLLVPGEFLLKIVASMAGSVFIFAVSVVLSGLLMLSGPALVPLGRNLGLRLAGPRGSSFVALAGATIRSVARGVIGIAFLQSISIGVALILADVPHAGLLTVVALILAVAQIGDTILVVPLVLWFWLTRDPTMAVLFTLAMLPGLLLEYIAKPIVLGQGLETPKTVILAGVFGGTVAYGLTGLFIGPIVLAMMFDLITFWARTPIAPDTQ